MNFVIYKGYVYRLEREKKQFEQLQRATITPPRMQQPQPAGLPWSRINATDYQVPNLVEIQVLIHFNWDITATSESYVPDTHGKYKINLLQFRRART